MGRFNSAYEPAPSDTTSRRKPVSVWIAVTVAPGRIPPLASETVPLICAVVWAQPLVAASRQTRETTSSERDVRFMEASSPPRSGPDRRGDNYEGRATTVEWR